MDPAHVQLWSSTGARRWYWAASAAGRRDDAPRHDADQSSLHSLLHSALTAVLSATPAADTVIVVSCCCCCCCNRREKNYRQCAVLDASIGESGVFYYFDMPSDLWRKRVTKSECKFTDFYGLRKSVVEFFLPCCLLVLLYIMLVVFYATATMLW